MSQPCPSCGTESGGRFCSHCGAALAAECRGCGSPIPAGGRFCNQCGSAAAPAAGTRPRSAPALPWVIAGVAVVAAVVASVAMLPRPGASPAAPPAAAAAPAQAAADPAAVDLAAMTPRERADRLFNRVMEGVARGDTAQLGFFADMAVQAYGMVEQRDPDLHYHLAELHHVRGDAAAVQAQADTLLATHPTHLLGLYSAARAADMRGEGPAAATIYRRFVEVYPDEIARDLPEYREHVVGLPSMRAEAERAAGERRER